MNFYDRYVELCSQKGEKPTPVAIKLGLSSSSATNWKNGKIPRPGALAKIAGYFGVTVGYLLGDQATNKTAEVTPTSPAPDYNLTPQEQAVILRFRSCPSLQAAVIKLLDAPESPDELIPVYVAAKSDDEQPHRVEYLTKEEVERIKNAKPVDFDF
ncbi:MAG: hypothetical protein E7645_07970 [Ruminococcaceae bacterium]|nr:hypothetical protein [Oscillospiraceae bacterium]